MADNRVNVKIPREVAEALDNLKDEKQSRNDMAIEMIQKGLNVPESFELDNTLKQPFFKYLTGGKGKEYQDDLMNLELTEQELIDLALSKTNKRYEDLLKEAVISYAKEQITYAARREHQDKNSDGSPEKRLQDAFAELTDLMMDGRYRPRGGRLNISAVAQRARVNYNTAKNWAKDYQPELLES